MSILSSFWEQFLNNASKKYQTIPVVFSILKQTTPIELTDDKLVIGCQNDSLLNFLQKKIKQIETELQLYAGKKIRIELIINPKKKNTPPPPLFSFSSSKEELFLKSRINPKYSFENFAVSPTNQVAYAAAQAVANSLGNAYNPLFLYGGVGVGKTHLAQAIAKKIIEKNPEKKVLFCPGDSFINELVEAIKDKTTPKFRRKYRQLDLLIVDDIQFIAGKIHVQEEFFHTFNSVLTKGGQIILTSDRPPNEIKNLQDRLRSRFSGGLTVDIQPPDFELRTAILLIKAKEKNIFLDIEAAKVIAEQITDSRALEGTLISIYAKILGKKEKIDLEAVESFFSQKNTSSSSFKVSPNDVVRAVCSFYNIKQSHLKGPKRTENLTLPRHITMYLLRKELKMKFEEIAFHLKRKDHTTVIHAVEKIEGMIIKNPTLKQEIHIITQNLFSST